MSEPLLEFTSHVAGKNARVRVFPDRLEWSREGSTVGHWTKASLTLGASLLAGRKGEAGISPSCLPRLAATPRPVGGGGLDVRTPPAVGERWGGVQWCEETRLLGHNVSDH